MHGIVLRCKEVEQYRTVPRRAPFSDIPLLESPSLGPYDLGHMVEFQQAFAETQNFERHSVLRMVQDAGYDLSFD